MRFSGWRDAFEGLACRYANQRGIVTPYTTRFVVQRMGSTSTGRTAERRQVSNVKIRRDL